MLHAASASRIDKSANSTVQSRAVSHSTVVLYATANLRHPHQPSPKMASRAMSSSGSSAALLLGKQFKQMQTDKDIPGISCGLVGSSVFEWEIMIMLDEEQDSLYGGRKHPTICRTTIPTVKAGD